MATHKAHTKANAKAYASMFRKKGYNTSIYKKKGEKGYRISVTRGKK